MEKVPCGMTDSNWWIYSIIFTATIAVNVTSLIYGKTQECLHLAKEYQKVIQNELDMLSEISKK
jgi:hypothetical protein